MPATRLVTLLNMRSVFSVFLCVGTLCCWLAACAPPPRGDTGETGSEEIPELTRGTIEDEINDARVFDVLPESGTGEPISWGFDSDEPKEIKVVDQKIDGDRATIVLDIKTHSAPRSRIMRELAGQLRTDWELHTGWVIRRWEMVHTENISMKYKDLPKAEQKGNTKPPDPPDQH